VAPLTADMPTGMADVLAACLTAEPNDRIATGAELAAQLDLCLKPRARNLLYPPPHGWCRLVRRYPIGAIILIGLLANAPMAVYNYIFNDREIISWLQGAEKTFYLIQGIINAVAFTTGITAFVIGSLPVRRGLRKMAAGEKLTPTEQRSLMRSSLGPGLRIATIGLVCWLLAGLAYPLTLRASLDQVPVWVFAHFVASLALCGLIAGTYPFFLGTFLAVRAFYPALVQPGAGDDKDLGDLEWIDNWISVYLVLASAVPLLAMTLLSLRKLGSPMLVGVLGVVGLVGFVAVYCLSRVIRGDLEALRDIVRPTPITRTGWPPGESD
jgi:eukaryotic-like serine/threonine-protein kinase